MTSPAGDPGTGEGSGTASDPRPESVARLTIVVPLFAVSTVTSRPWVPGSVARPK